MESAALVSMQSPQGHQTYGRRSKRAYSGSGVDGKSESPKGHQTLGRRFRRASSGSAVDGKSAFQPLARAKRSVSMSKGGCQNQDDSAPGKVSIGQSVEANGLVREITSRNPSSRPVQPVQSGKRFSDDEIREFRTLVDRGYLFQEVERIVVRKIKLPDKITELKERLSEFLDKQKKANDDEIEMLRLDCRALREEISLLNKDKEVLKSTNEEVNLRYKLASQRVKFLEARIGAEMKRAWDGFGRLSFWSKKRNAVEEPVQATQNSVLKDLELHRNKHFRRVKQKNSDTPLELQRCPREDESPEELKRKQANENYKNNPIWGSYTDEEARPTRLSIDLSITRAAVTEFQRMLFECVDTKSPWSPWELLDCNPGDAFFARPSHSSHYFRSAVNRVFYEGFENVSFNTMCGISRFLDPDHRREIFYKYYLSEREQESANDNEDPQFEEFCQMKVYSLLRKTLPAINNGDRAEVSYLELLGGPELVSVFKSAAKAVWLLHKLAFSFEPPSTVFRVEDGADFDPRYMESKILQLDDDERLQPKVGFMIDPGLCLPGAPIMQCEVYLAASATTIPGL